MPTIAKQVCDKCGGPRVRRNCPSSRDMICKHCANIRQKSYYAKNREHIRELQSRRIGRMRIIGMVSVARQRAKERNIPFDLKLSDVVIPDVCPVLGIPLMFGRRAQPEEGSPTIDRVVPELGYVKGNIVVISHLANRIKSNASIEQLERVLSYVRKEHDRIKLERLYAGDSN